MMSITVWVYGGFLLSSMTGSAFGYVVSTSRNRMVKRTHSVKKSGNNQQGRNFFTVPTAGTSNASISSSISSSTSAADQSISGIESWLRSRYDQAMSIKCPFFRRRAADFLDAANMILSFLVNRHKSLPLNFSPPGWRCLGDTAPKQTGISTTELLEVLRADWKETNSKGYYITGKLTTSVYRDDVVFDGPDPDMPVRGLRKYLNAASQLFDQKDSQAQLLSICIVDDNVVAKWRIKGILRLPWRPRIPEWTGETIYRTDDQGLIVRHEEKWDKSVLQAFTQTLAPQLANCFWSEGTV